MVIVQPQIELYKTHISLLTEVWVPTIFYLTLLFTFFPTAHVGDFPLGRNDLKCDREEGLRYINGSKGSIWCSNHIHATTTFTRDAQSGRTHFPSHQTLLHA